MKKSGSYNYRSSSGFRVEVVQVYHSAYRGVDIALVLVSEEVIFDNFYRNGFRNILFPASPAVRNLV